MIDHLPRYINWVFILTTLVTVWFFYKANKGFNTAVVLVFLWMILQGFVGYSLFYTETHTIPPRFPLLVLPPVILTIILFFTEKGNNYLDNLDSKWLTYLHTVRIPVELVLLWLFLNGKVPQLMTFEGRNFDILSGLTAPLVGYLGYQKRRLSKSILLLWNFLCLALLFNIVINAILAAPSPFQQLAFDQPNVGVLYFPFVWLPGLIVPLVLFSHLVSVRQLIMNKGLRNDR